MKSNHDTIEDIVAEVMPGTFKPDLVWVNNNHYLGRWYSTTPTRFIQTWPNTTIGYKIYILDIDPSNDKFEYDSYILNDDLSVKQSKISKEGKFSEFISEMKKGNFNR